MGKTSIIRETKDIVVKAGKEAKEHWKEPPDAQIPVGDSGWYTSPNLQTDKGVSPHNCDEWPDSPYCGGNPWTKTPVGFDFDYGVDKCGAWVEATPILGFTKLPPVSVGYRQPGECREEKKPPPPPPTPDDTSRPVSPLKFPTTIDPNATVMCVLVQKYTYFYVWQDSYKDPWGRDTPPSYDIQIVHQGMGDSYYPTERKGESYNRYAPNNQYITLPYIGGASTVTFYTSQKQTYHYEYTEFPPKAVIDTENTSGQGTNYAFIVSDQRPPWPIYPSNKRVVQRNLKGNYLITCMNETTSFMTSCVLYGTINEFKKDWENYVIDSYTPSAAGGSIYKEEWEVGYISIPDKGKYAPPPNDKRKKDCCMQCCNGGSNQANKQDQDLSEIKRMLKELTKRVGVAEYPVKMPASLNADYDDKGNKKEPGTVTEENLTSVIGRFIRYFDGVMGELGVGFKVSDADPTKPGDQPAFITANNVADLLGEIYSHVFDMWIMQYQMMHVNQRHATESMLARKVGIQNHFLLEALLDWTGTKHKDLTKKVPFLFDIEAEKFDDFVKNKEMEIQVVDFDPDDKNAQSFADDMMILKRAAGIIEAVHTRKFAKGDDVGEAIRAILHASRDGVERINKDELRTSTSKEDFDQWLRDAENAFINRIGQGDLQNPYGVPYANRPRLTKIQDSLEGGESSGN